MTNSSQTGNHERSEQLLEEYTQAVTYYQKVVLELQEAGDAGSLGALESLLGEADAAKEALNCCRNRYKNYDCE